MKSHQLKYFLFLIISLTFFYQCSRKLTGWGDDGDIHVLADSTIWEASQSILREVFERKIITPQNETIFTIIKGELNNFKRFKNLIFLATLDSNEQVCQLVKANLTPQAKQRVERGDAYVFIQKEKWATDQLIMFLISIDVEALKKKIIENKNYLFNLFDNYWNEAQARRMFRSKEQKDIEKYLLEKYNWMVKVQHDYKVFIENADSHFVMLRRMLPERWLFVHWIDTFDPSVITKQWSINKRNKLCAVFYENDIVEEKFVQPDTEEVEFLGRRALKIIGLWRNDKKQAGGPFRSYTFYDEESQRIYMLDFAIFSPRLKRAKRNYLRQAEIILHTFKTGNEISVEDL